MRFKGCLMQISWLPRHSPIKTTYESRIRLQHLSIEFSLSLFKLFFAFEASSGFFELFFLLFKFLRSMNQKKKKKGLRNCFCYIFLFFLHFVSPPFFSFPFIPSSTIYIWFSPFPASDMHRVLYRFVLDTEISFGLPF